MSQWSQFEGSVSYTHYPCWLQDVPPYNNCCMICIHCLSGPELQVISFLYQFGGIHITDHEVELLAEANKFKQFVLTKRWQSCGIRGVMISIWKITSNECCPSFLSYSAPGQPTLLREIGRDQAGGKGFNMGGETLQRMERKWKLISGCHQI